MQPFKINLSQKSLLRLKKYATAAQTSRKYNETEKKYYHLLESVIIDVENNKATFHKCGCDLGHKKDSLGRRRYFATSMSAYFITSDKVYYFFQGLQCVVFYVYDKKSDSLLRML